MPFLVITSQVSLLREARRWRCVAKLPIAQHRRHDGETKEESERVHQHSSLIEELDTKHAYLLNSGKDAVLPLGLCERLRVFGARAGEQLLRRKTIHVA